MKNLLKSISKFLEPINTNPYSEVKTCNESASVKDKPVTQHGEHLGINHAGNQHDIHWNNLKGDFRTCSPNESLFKY